MPLPPLCLELYTRPGCHLGNDLRAICERLAGEIAFEFTEVNIEDDPAVQARYEREIPILFVDGRLVVRYRTSERELRRILNWQRVRRRFWRGQG
jgi:glutaredoxin